MPIFEFIETPDFNAAFMLKAMYIIIVDLEIGLSIITKYTKTLILNITTC